MSQAGLIDIESSNPQIPTSFDTDSGSAIALGNVLEVIGGAGIETSGSGNTITIALTGGGAGIDEINVDASTAPGTDPVVPTALGAITVTGSQVAASTVGANVIRTNSLAANTYTIEVQRAGSTPVENTTLNGVAHFNSNQFTVSNGYVTLTGGSAAIDTIALDTGTSPISPTAGGMVTMNGAVVAAGTNPVRTDGTGANTMAVEVQISQALAAADATKIGLSNFDSTDFTVAATGFVELSTTGAGKTITGDTGGALSPTANNWNIVGGAALSAGTNASVTSGSGSTLTVTSINTAKWIVDPTANRGTHTTIAGAIAAASNGETVFIRPGTYGEDLTLKAGVYLSAFECDPSSNGTGHVIISGNCTFSSAGSVVLSGIQLQTNSAALLSVTGSAASVVMLENCYLNCTNNTGITFSTSNASARINLINCKGNIGTTGITLYTNTSTGTLVLQNTRINNSGAATTASNTSAGVTAIFNSTISLALTTSSSGVLNVNNSTVDCNAINTAAITTAGTGSSSCFSSYFSGGTASGISIGSGTSLTVGEIVVDSTNTNAITGAGSVVLGSVTFPNTGHVINTTTQTLRYLQAGQYQGRTSNSAPSAGMLGEEIRSAVGAGSAVSLTTNTAANVTSISLTPGIWDINGALSFSANATTNTTEVLISVSAVSATVDGNYGDASFVFDTLNGIVRFAPSIYVPQFRVSLSATTTYYLVARSTFTVSSTVVYGRISAVRVA